MEQYDLTYLAVIDRDTDEAIAVTAVCLYALSLLKNWGLHYYRFDFIELEKAEYDTYISMEVVPRKSIFKFMSKQ